MNSAISLKQFAGLHEEHYVMTKVALAQMKRQIETSATFLPNEILRHRNDTISRDYVGVVLLLNVTGLTMLAEKYNKIGNGGIYRLTATVNAYCGALLEALMFYGGDVVKFGREMYIAVWKVKSEDSINDILHEVMMCSMTAQQALGVFETEINTPIRFKIAVSCGNLTFHQMGDDTLKDYILMGETLYDAQEAQESNNWGDITFAASAWAQMLQDRYDVINGKNGSVKIVKVNYKHKEYAKMVHYEEKFVELMKHVKKHFHYRQLLHSSAKYRSETSNAKITDTFVRSLPERLEVKQVSRNWTVTELNAFLVKPLQDQIEDGQSVEYLTQMRQLTLVYIEIQPSTVHTFKSLRMSFQTVHRVVDARLGILHKTIMYRGNFMLYVLFGLRGMNHELECQNALRAAYEIRVALMKMNDVEQVSVAVTTGIFYCGVMGHPMRREYSLIGSAYIRAEQLLLAFSNRIVCDYKTFRNSKLSSFYFLELKLEGQGAICEYNEDFETVDPWDNVLNRLVGRRRENEVMLSLLNGRGEFGEVSGICFNGPSKIGKTAIIEGFARLMTAGQSTIAAFIELEQGSHIPYFCVSKIYQQLYDRRATIDSNDLLVIRNLPRTLRNFGEEVQNRDEDIAYRKYRLLNYFRDITVMTTKQVVIMIDNLEYIDLQSWEILEIALSEKHIKLITTAYFELRNWDLRFKISINDNIKTLDILPIDGCHVPMIACLFLNATGIASTLVNLLTLTCKGRPGYIQSCLLYMVNEGHIKLKLIAKEDIDTNNYVFPFTFRMETSNVLEIITYYPKFKSQTALTFEGISLNLIDSYSTYEQLVIKTASVLGDTFSRTLLIIALNYPSNLLLSSIIQRFFDEDIFDCGSRHLYSQGVDPVKPCCRCYFNGTVALPKYAHCKVIHFKNNNLKVVAYRLVPENQKKDLHILCTNVLEYMTHLCPTCIMEASFGYAHFEKYKDVMSFCNDAAWKKSASKHVPDKRENIKDCVRKYFVSKLSRIDKEPETKFLPDIFNPLYCNCLEIHSRVFKDLIYHSERGDDMAKRIFFTMQYGFVLLCLFDYATAISSLTEARELCMINATLPTAGINDTFRRIHMGKINYGLALASMDLQKMKTAKNYLTVALRQYYIPSVSLSYKHFNRLLTRTCLYNVRNIHPHIYDNQPTKNDLGLCVALCARLFFIEGDYKLAKSACGYSIFLLKSVNPNIAILLDVYCTATDILTYCGDSHVCKKLQKCVRRDLLVNYANHFTPNLYCLNTLLNAVFFAQCISGEIKKTIRLGYRILDISHHLFYRLTNFDMLMWLIFLLLYDFRLKDAYDLCILLKTNYVGNSEGALSIYYTACFQIYLRTGFCIESADKMIDFAAKYRDSKKSSLGGYYQVLHNLVHLHYSKKGQYQLASEWEYGDNFILNKTVGIRALLIGVEIQIYAYLRSRRQNSSNIATEQKRASMLLKNLNQQTKRLFKLFRPSYLCMYAWYCKLRKRDKTSQKILAEAVKYSDKQGNFLFKAWALRIKTLWKDNDYVPQDSGELELDLDLTPTEWAQRMPVFLLE